jgi:hypothetical protein
VEHGDGAADYTAAACMPATLSYVEEVGTDQVAPVQNCQIGSA